MYLIDEAGPETARNCVGQIVDYCLSFETFPERGAVRDDLRPGLRVAGYRGKASIAFVVEENIVSILVFSIAAKTSASTIMSKRLNPDDRSTARPIPAAMAAW
ncbi:type II toxin-antitoxin system RelE/ParE family toxin [Rhizobium laguerreae]|uniref:type II toxin-antitoxin system RelE/ParE family toxin n=1 Tax=Rhizobium laguerreae TaxID=1076926 RepID=UPI001FE0033F|nr:type II toxin-antitoxin system RelE/ParE family toxin [Rhizobium laguerreae]